MLARQIGDNEQIDPTPLGGWPVDDEGNELVIDRVDPDGPGAADEWRRYLVRWNRWNAVRTVALVLAAAGFALAR